MLGRILVFGVLLVISGLGGFALYQQFAMDAGLSILASIAIFAVLTTLGLSVELSGLRKNSVEQIGAAKAELAGLKRSVEGQEVRIADIESGELNKDLIAEVKVLQTLLTQISAERSKKSTEPSAATRQSAPSEAPPVNNEEGHVELDEATVANIMHNALKENRLDVYVQPIVTLPSRNHVHYECFSRVRDEHGETIFARDYLPHAERTGMTGTLDNLLLFRLIQLVRKLGHRRPGVKFFCNISSTSLHDCEFFPQFVEYMLGNEKLADRLVFEFVQSDVVNMSDSVERNLLALGQKGFRYSMDNVTDKEVDSASLAERYFRFVKMDGDLLMASGEKGAPGAFKERLARHDIELIASKVEDEETLLALLDNSIDFGQGFLFGEPKLNTAMGDA